MFSLQGLHGLDLDGDDMTTKDARSTAFFAHKPRRGVRPRSREEIAEGVRRQREHLTMMDGADPLRGGVAD